MSYIPIAPPPKPAPDPTNFNDNYSVLVPLQDVTHNDYDPLTNGEITRRVAFPRSLFRKPWEYLTRGSLRPCEVPPKLRSYSPLAKLYLGKGKAFEAIWDEKDQIFKKKQGIDPRATVELVDMSGIRYGHVFSHPCEDAQCVLTFRPDPWSKEIIGYIYFRKNYP